jgi:hypothetical protein
VVLAHDKLLDRLVEADAQAAKEALPVQPWVRACASAQRRACATGGGAAGAEQVQWRGAPVCGAPGSKPFHSALTPSSRATVLTVPNNPLRPCARQGRSREARSLGWNPPKGRTDTWAPRQPSAVRPASAASPSPCPAAAWLSPPRRRPRRCTQRRAAGPAAVLHWEEATCFNGQDKGTTCGADTAVRLSAARR